MAGSELSIEQRLAARERPHGSPIMYQSWGKLLFMHWQMPIAVLRKLIPERLEIDTFEGAAWVAITPFTVWNARPVYTPPMPLVSHFHEINVRTYVHYEGVPGVWFFSLDANSLVNVTGARTVFGLPYLTADITLDDKEGTIDYASSRTGGDSHAEFAARWQIGGPRPSAEPGTLEFFLIERYCLYTAPDGKFYRCRIHHEPWPLQHVRLESYNSTMMQGDGLPAPAGDPLLHSGGPVHVEVWPLEEL